MKLTKMILENNVRLAQLAISYFEFSPKSDQITIIGLNGSGKSTIMDNWTPLPAPSSDFDEKAGGLKITEWEHQGAQYKITSAYNGGAGKHSFEKDGITLIENGTASVVTQMCKSRFKMDKDLHELMTGKKRFSTMSVVERREWIMRISGADFGFVMDLFTKASTKMRDAIGAVRHTRQRLVELEKDRVAPEDIAKYRKNLDEINKNIATVIDLKHKAGNDGTPPDMRQRELDDVLKSVERQTSQYLKRIQGALDILDETHTDPLQFVDRYTELNTELVHANNLLSKQLTDLKALEEKEKLVEESQSLSALQQERDSAAKERDALLQQYSDQHYFHRISHPHEALRQFSAHEIIVNGILAQWNYNAANSPVEADLQSAQNYKIETEKSLMRVRREVDELSHRLNHIRNAEALECPKCLHRFKMNVRDMEESSITEQLTSLGQHEKQLEQTLVETNDTIQRHSEFISVLNDYKSLVRNTPYLKELWGQIQLSRALRDPAINIRIVIEDWVSCVKAAARVTELSANLEKLEEKIAFIQRIDIDQSGLSFFKEKLNSDIQHQYENISALNAAIKSNERVKQAVQVLTSLEEEVKHAVQSIHVATDNLVRATTHQTLESVNQQLNTDAYHVNSLLLRSQNSYSVLTELESSLETLNKTHGAYMLLVSELSPKEGFVAELLNGFLKQMLSDINSIIAALWTYDMEVQICKRADVELDFKFPLNVNNSKRPAPDVKDGSSSQIDVVDFAFKYVVAQYLELSDYPFLLDELAPTFDEVHRRNIMHYVRQLVDSNVCSQMVMISHYSETHSAFVKSEYLVTNPKNITVPNKYNENAIFR